MLLCNNVPGPISEFKSNMTDMTYDAPHINACVPHVDEFSVKEWEGRMNCYLKKGEM